MQLLNAGWRIGAGLDEANAVLEEGRAFAGSIADPISALIMKLLDVIREARIHLRENERVSLRMLRRQFERDDDSLDEVIEELVEVQQVARREGSLLVWSGDAADATPAGVPNTSSSCTVPVASGPF